MASAVAPSSTIPALFTPPIFDVVSAVLHPGDVVIAATDGVLDNLFDSDLQSLVAKFVTALNDDGKCDGVVLAAMAKVSVGVCTPHPVSMCCCGAGWRMEPYQIKKKKYSAPKGWLRTT